MSAIHRRRLLLLALATFLFLLIIICIWRRWMNKIIHPSLHNLQRWMKFNFENIEDFTNANNVTGFDFYIVPNIVHFILFEKSSLDFPTMVNILSVHKNHKPEKILMHCDSLPLKGKYWEMIKSIPNLQVVYMRKPTQVFGKNFSWVQHASDIARISVLRTYGGIYLDNDVYVVKSLDNFHKFEFAIGSEGKFLCNQVLVAHKDARFLKLYYESYRFYRPDLWYYNGGQLPTTLILYNMPHLVHRVPRYFGVHDLARMLYAERSPEWRTYYAIHLLIRHKPYVVPNDPVKDFDEQNIKTYPKTYGDMARMVLYGTTDFVPENATINIGL